MDYETSKAHDKVNGQHLDYSTSIVLKTILALYQQIRIDTRVAAKEIERSFYEIIISQLNDPSDLLEVNGFFDQCEGQCSVRKHVKKDENNGTISIEKEYVRYNVPDRHPICDGRKAVDQSTSEAVLDEVNEEEFWWCANQKCFQASRRLHKSDEWEQYSIIDILSILGIEYRHKELETYLSLINKVNRFLKHMKCRSCGQILRPVKQSNYAFYGVNDFHCKNEICDQHGVVIYLTHCLNGRCEQTIDSRDCVKCKPDGYDSSRCGWYVCNYCYSCCSDDVISRRIYILQKTGQQYKCHHEGHRGRSVCCNECGSPMGTNTFDEVQYNKALKWFTDQSQLEIPKFVVKSGQTKAGKWWFRFTRGTLSQSDFNNKLINLERLGFSIPDIKAEKSVQLVAEPFKIKRQGHEVLVCHNCNITVDFSNDFERMTAIVKYHNIPALNNSGYLNT